MQKDTALVLLGIVAAWSSYAYLTAPSPEDLCAEKLSALEFTAASTRADLFRARSECQALQIEFGFYSDIVKTCADSLKLKEDVAQSTMSSVAARYNDADIVECLKNKPPIN